MKRFMLVLLLCNVAGFVYAQEWNGLSLPEETHYAISYFGMNAGYGAMKIEGINFEGRKAVQITARAKSSNIFSLFYHVDDTIVSIIDAETLEPLWHLVDYHEGGYSRKVIYLFDYDGNKCVSEEGTIGIDKGILEPLGALCFLRMQNLKKDLPLKKEVFDGRDVKEVKAVVNKETKVKTLFGLKEAIAVKPILKDFRKEGITEVEEDVTIYFQKEPPRLPYLVKGKLLIGSLKAKLVKII